jgi:hypothetical protein
MKLKINNLMEDKNILWKKISCKCDKNDIEKSYPLIECLHCTFQKQEDSMPRESFTVNNDLVDKKGKIIKKQDRTVKEITIIRGTKYDEIVAWSY